MTSATPKKNVIGIEKNKERCKRAFAKLGFFDARRYIWLVSSIVVLMLVFVVPPAATQYVNSTYQIEKDLGKRLLGIIKPKSESLLELRERKYTQILVGSWVLGCLLIVASFIVGFLVIRPKPKPDSIAFAKTTIRAGEPPRTQHIIGPKGRYRIEKALASGGAGVVYLGFDDVLQRNVAVKELFPDLADDAAHLARFKQEARALAALNHPHVIQIYDFLEEDERLWLIMEYAKGGSLADWIKNLSDNCQTPQPIEAKIEISKQISKGLLFAHQQGLVHRDIKPDNVLFTDSDTVKLSDFGIVKPSSASVQTMVGLTLGSPAYMSPEQIDGAVATVQSDIYALGVTMYLLFTNALPFKGDAQSVLSQHLTKIPTAPMALDNQIPVALNELILNMLEKKPENRPNGMMEVLASLNKVQG